jgi:hypothetical protein
VSTMSCVIVLFGLLSGDSPVTIGRTDCAAAEPLALAKSTVQTRDSPMGPTSEPPTVHTPATVVWPESEIAGSATPPKPSTPAS